LGIKGLKSGDGGGNDADGCVNCGIWGTGNEDDIMGYDIGDDCGNMYVDWGNCVWEGSVGAGGKNCCVVWNLLGTE